MKFRAGHTASASKPPRATVVRSMFGSALAALLLTVILEVSNTTNAASAGMVVATTTDYIYLYEGGRLVFQPTDYVQDGSVYTDLQALVGTVNPVTGNVMDEDNNVIGLIAAEIMP